MESRLIAAAVKSRDAYYKLVSTEVCREFSDKAIIIWKEISDYYDADDSVSSVDLEVLKSKITRKFPKHSDLLVSYFDNIDDVSVQNIVSEAIAVKLEYTSHSIAAELVAGKYEKADALIDTYNSLRDGELSNASVSESIINPSVSSIIEESSGEHRIAILPKSLNSQLKGGVLRQHHIVVFAPTDMGKSLFALNMVYGFLKQDLKVLYCANEDPATDMIMRLMWRITDMEEDEMRKDSTKAQERLDNINFSNLVFVEMAPGTKREIEELIVEHEPDIVIVDQIRNLDMGDNNKVIALEKSAAMMRMFGKKYNLVPVSLTQAGDSATGKTILGRGDIDFSNVGIPGTADLLLGIGATDEMEGKGERMISFVKNKISGNKTPVKVWFDTRITKVT